MRLPTRLTTLMATLMAKPAWLPLLSGRAPGQLVIQLTDRCNARCPQCGMRAEAGFPRTDLPVERARKLLERAAETGIHAVSFTGGEPFLRQEALLSLLDYASSLGLKYLRTGANGFFLRNSESAGFGDRVQRLADRMARTRLRNFWLSLDSADPETHEAGRGLPGVTRGMEKALPLFHAAGIRPTANLGLNRNLGGDWRKVPALAPGMPEGARAFRQAMAEGLRRFFRRVEEMGFTLANCCYPMSVDSGAAYAATSTDAVVRFSPGEKRALLLALLDVLPEARERVRLFTPSSAILTMLRRLEGGHRLRTPAGCRGGLDFFFVDAGGSTYPCGYRAETPLAPFERLDPATSGLTAGCEKCDWECFRDPSELFSPLMDARRRPLETARELLQDSEYRQAWLGDVAYARRCDWFNGRG